MLDVWFDSGTAWTSLHASHNAEATIADLIIEGDDQRRGWFQSLLWTKLASGQNAEAPYKQILTHAFVVDQDGRKMSKSVGNVVQPEDVSFID